MTKHRAEKYWLDETCSGELRRRAMILRQDGFFAVAKQFEDRARFLDAQNCRDEDHEERN